MGASEHAWFRGRRFTRSIWLRSIRGPRPQADLWVPIRCCEPKWACARLGPHLLGSASPLPLFLLQYGVSPIPIGVGNSDEQSAFLKVHAPFLRYFPVLKALAEKTLCRTLPPPPQSEVDRLLSRPISDPEVLAFEDKVTTDRVVFFLGRVAIDDFSEILVLSGNGLGIGAYKVLRGMYEKVVHAVYLDKHEVAARRFARQSDVYKEKLATRLQEFDINILAGFTAQDIADLKQRAKAAKMDKPLPNLADMSKVSPHLHPLYGPYYLEPTVHLHANAFGLERRLLQNPAGGYRYNEADYRHQARRALLLGHNLFIQVLAVQNSRFDLGLGADLEGCAKAFTEIWGPTP